MVNRRATDNDETGAHARDLGGWLGQLLSFDMKSMLKLVVFFLPVFTFVANAVYQQTAELFMQDKQIVTREVLVGVLSDELKKPLNDLTDRLASLEKTVSEVRKNPWTSLDAKSDRETLMQEIRRNKDFYDSLDNRVKRLETHH